MSKYTRLFFLFWTFTLPLCIPTPAKGELPAWRSARITNEKGLSNSAVNHIFQDRRGFMWFGTWDGLNRFDGKDIITFYPDPFSENSLSNNIIRKMLEDDQGHLWIITERGVDRYSHDLENFTSYFTEHQELSMRENNLQGHIGPDGQIWVSAWGLGLFRFDYETNQFIQAQSTRPFLEGCKFVDDFFFSGQSIFFLEGNMLRSFDSQTGKENKPSDLTEIIPAGTGGIVQSWFFTFREAPYLFAAFRNGGGILYHLKTSKYTIIQPANEELRFTSLDAGPRDEYIWLGTDDGNLLQFNPLRGKTTSVLYRIPELADKKVKIWSVFESSDGLLWIGTDGEGVFRTMINPKPFFQIQRGTAEERQLNHQIVRAIFEDSQENLWIGTRGNGLNKIPFKTGPTQFFNTSGGLTNNAVLSLQKDNNQLLWIGHDGYGIDILDTQTGKFFHFPRDLKGGEHLDFGSVYAICEDAFGYVWLGTSGFGVIGLEVKRDRNNFILASYRVLNSDSPGSILKSNIIYSIVEEAPNILWLASRGAGIYRFNTLTGDLQNFSAGTNPNQLIDNDILSLLMGTDGYLWVGSSGGLTRVNLRYQPYSFLNFTTRDGLPNNTIHAILEDNDRNIWVSTNKGLSKLDRQNRQFLNFNSADGLQSNEFTDGAAHVGKKTGRFFFGGINGLDWFYPHQIQISERNAQVVFTSFKLHNSLIRPGDTTRVLSRHINDTERITLKHHQNFITIGFTTLNFVNPDKTLFQYKLENFHSQWVEPGTQREAIFTNVPPGRYRLLVRATNEDGIWSDTVRPLQIIIKPPIWRTWPAYIFYFAAILLTIYMVYVSQVNRLKRKQAMALDRIKQQKEKELHQYKLQFFTNLAHEFGTPLTLIFASAASLLSEGIKQADSSRLIKIIYQNSKRMQRLVQELLEFRKIDAGREKPKLVKTELVKTINLITDAFSHYARENELEIIFDPTTNELWTLTDTDKLEKILLNLLSNAIKFTLPGGSINVHLEQDEKNIVISVSDTGVGISNEALPNIFESFYQQVPKEKQNHSGFKGIGIGLAYTKSLVELLEGTITVSSKPAQGTTFKVILPLIMAPDPQIPDTANQKQISNLKMIDSLADEFLHTSGDEQKDISRARLWTTPKKYRLLVVEDDYELSNMLFKMLYEQYEVLIAKDGLDALEALSSNRIDLVISDVIMPRMNGLKLCSRIKSDPLFSHIPVILLTAKAELENRIEGLETGADSYIPKPFHPRHLFVRIEKLLKGREMVSAYFRKNFGTQSYDLQQDYTPRDKELLEKCISFIEENYANETIDADTLASHLAMSKAQLYRKVKALTGLTPHGLIKNFRLKKARQMIAEGEYSVSDIIVMTGFNNRTYFYRSYKELFGETPGEIHNN